MEKTTIETTVAPLLDHVQKLDDPRIVRTKLHSLTEILFIAIAGSVAGAEGWRELEAFGHAQETWLSHYLPLPEGMPSDDTFRRVIARLDPVAFEACFRQWMAAALSLSKGDLISRQDLARLLRPSRGQGTFAHGQRLGSGEPSGAGSEARARP